MFVSLIQKDLRSKIDIVQAAGRALRLSKATNKKFGYILVPLYVPENMDPETASKETSFEEIISVIGALSTQDSRIAEYLKAVSEGRKPTVGNKVDGIISINTLTQINSEKFEKAILIKVWDKIARVNFVPYEEAKKYALSLKLTGLREWNIHVKSNKNFPPNIPKGPDTVYKDKWEGWGTFLGTGRVSVNVGRNISTNWASYEETKKYALSLKLTGLREWNIHVKSNKNFPPNIPKGPDTVYKDKWEGWGTFLGTGRVSANVGRDKKTNWVSYEEAKKYALSLKLTGMNDWNAHTRNSKNFPPNIPKGPDSAKLYEGEWEGWGTFLGTGRVSANVGRDINTNWASYEEAKKYAKNLEFTNQIEWFDHARNSKNFPANIPKKPNSAKVYKDKWEGWGTFLGNEKKKD